MTRRIALSSHQLPHADAADAEMMAWPAVLPAAAASITATSWKSGVSGNWAAGTNWTSGVPGTNSDASITVAGTYTVTMDSAAFAHALILNNASATLSVSNLLSLGGTASISAGTLFATGTGAVTGGTVTLGGGTISLSNGSTLANGVLNMAAAGHLITNGGVFDGETCQGVVDISTSNAALTLRHGLTMTGAAGSGQGSINLTGANARLITSDNITLDNAVMTIGGAGQTELLFLASAAVNTPTLTLGSTLTLSQTASFSNVYLDTTFYTNAGGVIVNNGTMTLSGTGSSFNIKANSFVNAGKISVSGGDYVTISGTSWSNAAGSISVSGGTLVMGSVIAGNALGSMTNTGGFLDLTGTVNNSGNTLTLGNGLSGVLTLGLGGVFSGGTLVDANGQIAGQGGTLLGVTYAGTLNLNTTNASMRLQNTSFTGASGTGTGSINLTGLSAKLLLVDSFTLDNAMITMGSAGNAAQFFLQSSSVNAPTLTLGAGTTIVQTAPGSSDSIDLSFYTNGGGQLINQGTITTAGGAFAINGVGNTRFVNQGVVSIGAGESFAINTAGFTNTGTFAMAGGTLALSGLYQTSDLGHVTSTGGLIRLLGTLNNSGATLTLGAGGLPATTSLDLGARINGGVISDAAGALVLNGGTLSSVAYQGTLNLAATNAAVHLGGTPAFSGAGGSGSAAINLTGVNAKLVTDDSVTINGAVINAGGSNAGNLILLSSVSASNPILTLGANTTLIETAAGGTAGIDLSFQASGNGTLINNGAMQLSAQNGQFTIHGIGASNFINSGSVTVSNADSLTISTGAISNSGTMIAGIGGMIGLGSSALSNFAAGTLTGGAFEADQGGKFTLSDNAIVTVDQASLTLSGVGSVIQAYQTATHSMVSLDASLAQIGSAGTLRVLNGRNFVATANGGSLAVAGLLALGGGTLSAAQCLLNAGTLAGYGSVAASVVDNGLIEAAGGVLALAGGLSGAGTLTADLGATVSLSNGGSFSGAVSGAGSLNISGATTFTLAAPPAFSIAATSIGAGATLDLFGGAALGAGSAISGAGTLRFDGALASTLSAAALAVSHVAIGSGATLSGSGTLAGAVANAGLLQAAGGTLLVQSGISGNGGLAAGAAATLDIQGGGSLGGALAGAGTISLTGNYQAVAGFALGAADLVQTGSLALASGLQLTNQAGDIYALAAPAKTAVTQISGLAGSKLSNAGTINASGAGWDKIKLTLANSGSIISTAAHMAFLGAVSNNGIITDSAGLTSFNHNVTGSGTLQIGATGKLSLSKGAAASQTVDFLASKGELDLTNSQLFHATIADFAGADRIDLIKTVATGFTFANHVLSLSNGSTHIADLTFAGSYSAANFHLAADGHGGTVITFV